MLRGPKSSPNCAECPFSNNGQPRNPVPDIYPENPKFILLGLEPGRREVEQGMPFVGKSGQMVNTILKSLNVNRDDIFIGNSAICLPPFAFSDKEREQAYRCCRPRLNEELRQFPGKPIVTLGAASTKALTGESKITEIAGTYHEVDVDGTGKRVVIPTVHPAMILRDQQGVEDKSNDLLYWFIGYDIAKVANLADGQIEKTVFDIEYEEEDPERINFLLATFVERAEELGWFTCDVENTAEEGHSALEWKWTKLTAIGFGTPDYAISVAWDKINETGFAIIRGLLTSGLRVVFQNKIHDIQVLYKHGFEVIGPTEDTVLGHHVAFPGAPHKLQRVVSQYRLVESWKSDHRGGKLAELPYNAMDCQGTALIWEPIKKRLKLLGLESVYDLRNRIADIAMEISRSGIPFDLTINQELKDKYRPIVKNIEDKFLIFMNNDEEREIFLNRLAIETGKVKRKKDPDSYRERVEKRKEEYLTAWKKGKFTFKPKGSTHIAAYLLAKGIPLVELTKKGKISTKKVILQKYGHLPEVLDYLAYREAAKLLSVYIDKIPQFLDENNLAYPTYSVHKLTNRWGSRDPAIHTFPGKKSGSYFEVRKQIRARSGYKLVGVDGAQLEARIIALYSGDSILNKIFLDGLDLHTEMTKIVFPEYDLLPREKQIKLRELVKIVEYGKFYGAADATVWKQILKDHPSVLLVDVAKVGQAIEKRMTGIAIWHAKLLKQVVEEGKIVAVGGMTRFFPLRRGEKSAISNWGVQTAGSFWFDSGLVRLTDVIKARGYSKEEARIIIPWHDAVYMEVKEELAEEVGKMISEAFSQKLVWEDRSIYIPAKPKYGYDMCEVS